MLPEGTRPAFDQRLSQVLSNLMKNAVEASPENGAVRLTVMMRDAGALQIRVEDSGPGVPSELLPQLFTPFVTSKPKGSGVGLGLSISRELVLSLQGELTLANREAPETGCIAVVTLPVASSTLTGRNG
jgi:two-component system C4-dicarboxylate transport sensor histidine kinase DctB